MYAQMKYTGLAVDMDILWNWQVQGHLSRPKLNLSDDTEIGFAMGWSTHHYQITSFGLQTAN